MLKKSFAFTLVFAVLLCFSVPAFAAYGVDNLPKPTCSYPYVFYMSNPDGSFVVYSPEPLVQGGDYPEVKFYFYDGSSWLDVSDNYVLDDELMAVAAYTAKQYPELVYHNYDIYYWDGSLIAPASSPYADYLDVFDVLREQISVKNVVLALGVGVVVPVTLAFMWWGVRKLSSVLMIAFKKGKIKI